MELETVYVYPDGENYTLPPQWKSDDFEERFTTLCEVCDTVLHVHYKEPFASCGCGTTEWYK